MHLVSLICSRRSRLIWGLFGEDHSHHQVLVRESFTFSCGHLGISRDKINFIFVVVFI